MGNVIRKNTFYRQESAHLYICALCRAATPTVRSPDRAGFQTLRYQITTRVTHFTGQRSWSLLTLQVRGHGHCSLDR